MSLQDSLDERLQEDIWDSKIVVKVQLSKSETLDSSKNLSYYFFVPRVGYLCNIFGDLMKAFNLTQTDKTTIWMDYREIPIKWQLPFGVIADALNMNVDKPVMMDFHVTNIPVNVVNFQSLNSLKLQFNNSIKESNQIKYPKKKAILDLGAEDTKLLTDLSQLKDGSDMLAKFRKLILSINKKDDEEDNLEKFPVRLVFDKTDLILTKAVSLKGKNQYTIGQFFNDTFGEEVYSQLKERCLIKIHGIEVEESALFLFYYNNFYYLDNYLYIVFIEKNNEFK